MVDKTFDLVSSATFIVPCVLVMIMMIYYLKTTNEGKTFALSELKNNLIAEREDFKVIKFVTTNVILGLLVCTASKWF